MIFIKKMAFALYVLTALLVGATTAAQAGLLGATVQLRWLFPDTATVLDDDGSAVVGAGVEFPSVNVNVFTLDVTDTQLILTEIFPLGPGVFNFASADFNGYELTILSGEVFASVTESAVTEFLAADISFSGATLRVNYSEQIFAQGWRSILDVTTRVVAVPEPSALALAGSFLGGGLLLGRIARRRQKPDRMSPRQSCL